MAVTNRYTRAASITSFSMAPKSDESIGLRNKRQIKVIKMPKIKETTTNCPAALSALFLSFFPIYWEMTIPPPPARADNTKIKRNAN